MFAFDNWPAPREPDSAHKWSELKRPQCTGGFFAACYSMEAFIYPDTNAGAAVPKGQFLGPQLKRASVEMCGNF